MKTPLSQSPTISGPNLRATPTARLVPSELVMTITRILDRLDEVGQLQALRGDYQLKLRRLCDAMYADGTLQAWLEEMRSKGHAGAKPFAERR
jgi:hypothetical protein